MAFSEEELVFLALTFIFALVFLLLGGKNNTSTAKKTKKEKGRQRDTCEQKLRKQVRGQMANVCIASVCLGITKMCRVAC